MQKKSLTVWMFIVVTILSVVVDTAAGKKQSQQEQLQEIEKYISWQRQKIEDSYIGRSIDLRLRAEGEIRLLEVADKAIYAPATLAVFVDCQELCPSIAEVADKAIYDPLAAQAEVAETVLQINGYEAVPYGRFQTTTETSRKRFAVAQSRIAEVKNDILAKYECEAVILEKLKRYALTVGLIELEKRLKENVLVAKPKPTHGVITGIVYAEEKPSAIIDGQIVHEGETIHNVTVAKIHRDKIEFQKNDKRWKQKVRETPEAFWQ